jgi:hypothetical protein
MNFTKEQLGFLEKAKNHIKILEKRQEQVYNSTVSVLNLEKGGELAEALFDYMYNDFDSFEYFSQKQDEDVN